MLRHRWHCSGRDWAGRCRYWSHQFGHCGCGGQWCGSTGRGPAEWTTNRYIYNFLTKVKILMILMYMVIVVPGLTEVFVVCDFTPEIQSNGSRITPKQGCIRDTCWWLNVFLVFYLTKFYEHHKSKENIPKCINFLLLLTMFISLMKTTQFHLYL